VPMHRRRLLILRFGHGRTKSDDFLRAVQRLNIVMAACAITIIFQVKAVSRYMTVLIIGVGRSHDTEFFSGIL
jgi:hypothetical protein